MRKPERGHKRLRESSALPDERKRRTGRRAPAKAGKLRQALLQFCDRTYHLPKSPPMPPLCCIILAISAWVASLAFLSAPLTTLNSIVSKR